jgi:hypothetical protein
VLPQEDHMNMKTKVMAVAMLAALLGAFVLAPLSTSAQSAPNTVAPVPVTASKNGGTKNFNGEWTFTQFVAQGDAVFAEGVLTGQVTNKQDKVTHNVAETVLLPVSVASTEAVSTGGLRALQATTCSVLHLVLGPINLSLLGLNLTVGGQGGVPIVVDLTANPAGGLLGQLLCGLAGGTPLTGALGQILDIVNALNTLLGLLG